MKPLRRKTTDTNAVDLTRRVESLERRVIPFDCDYCRATYGQDPSETPFTGASQTINIDWTQFDTNNDETFPGLDGPGTKLWVAREGEYMIWSWFWLTAGGFFNADRAAQILFGSARIDTSVPGGVQPAYNILSGAFQRNIGAGTGGRRESVGQDAGGGGFGQETQAFSQIMDFASMSCSTPTRATPQYLNYVSTNLLIVGGGMIASQALVNHTLVVRIGSQSVLTPDFDPNTYELP